MDIRDTTARLRRTFAYPTDESSNGGTPEVLDEEGQSCRSLLITPPPHFLVETKSESSPTNA